jgi:hypothetical protein
MNLNNDFIVYPSFQLNIILYWASIIERKFETTREVC